MNDPDTLPIPLSRARAADEAPVGLAALDGGGRIVYANRTLAAMLGVADPAHLVGSDVRDFHPVPDVARALIHDALEGDELRGVDLEIAAPGGTPVPVHIRGRLLGGAAAGAAAVVVVEDVGAERARAEGDARTRTMTAVGRLAGGMAHHFNNLLGSVVGNVVLVRDALDEADPARRDLAQAVSAARRAMEIADLLLIVSGKEVAPRARVDLSSWIYPLAGELRRGLPTDVELVVRSEGSALPIRIDPSRLEQAVRNLVVNAEEAVTGGGRIVVEASALTLNGRDGEPTFVPPAAPGRYATVEVGDNGLGMNDETLARVFEPFFSTKRDREGAGLGLAAVYGIVVQAGGHVSVESAPVVGTRIRLAFPLAAEGGDGSPVALPGADRPADETPILAGAWPNPVPPQPDAPPHEPEPRRPMGGADGTPAEPAGAVGDETPEARGRILVVDDEDAIRDVMAKVLTRAGFQVATAVNGREAQGVMSRGGDALDLVITDVMMPELNGVELAHWIWERRPELPVLMVSGFAESPLVQGWVDAEPEAFLAKPFEPGELLERVRARLAAGERPGV